MSGFTQATTQAQRRRYKISGTKRLKPPGGNWDFPVLVPKHTKMEVWPALDHKGFRGFCLFVEKSVWGWREVGMGGCPGGEVGPPFSLDPTKVPSSLCLRTEPGKGAEERYPQEQGMPRHPEKPRAHSRGPDPVAPKTTFPSPGCQSLLPAPPPAHHLHLLPFPKTGPTYPLDLLHSSPRGLDETPQAVRIQRGWRQYLSRWAACASCPHLPRAEHTLDVGGCHPCSRLLVGHF